MNSENKELSKLKKNNVRFMRPILVDILGRMLDFTIPTEENSSMVKDGKGFDGSSIEGFARTEESDLRFLPDMDTIKVLPWEYKSFNSSWKEAMVFGNIIDANGNAYIGDTRAFLKSVLKKYSKIGMPKCGAELEFFIFENDKEPVHTDNGGYFRSGLYGEIRKESQLILNEMGIRTEFDHHEVASSQHEIDLVYNDALKMADDIVLSKYVIKKIARKFSTFASFMPKPFTKINGNGMHIHISVWKNGRNLFFEKGQGLSEMARSYIAGLIKYGKEIQLVLNQWINSYKRLSPGYEAPTYLVWGTKNRSTYIRVPEYLKGKEHATRIEVRSPDPACNPYLTLALIHAAGMQGVIDELKPRDPVECDIFHISDEEKKKMKIDELSSSLEEALKIFEQSKFIKEVLPDHIHKKMVENKKIECNMFNRSVTDYEIQNYFGIL